MKVLCKRATKQIVKGVIYDVLSLQNQNPGGNKFFHPNVVKTCIYDGYHKEYIQSS